MTTVIVNFFIKYNKYKIVYKSHNQVIETSEISKEEFDNIIADTSYKIILESSTVITYKKIKEQQLDLFGEIV
jgi:hypothetical protein